MIRLCVVDLSFIVTHAHQKIKALFTALILIMEQILHKIFAFLSVSFLLGIKKRKIHTELNHASKFTSTSV